MLREVTLDATRTHFFGRVPRAQYVCVLQVSAAHVYLTYPFVLSWSLLEAMACGVPIVGSDTPPVREVLRDGVNGRLVDFFGVADLCRTVGELLERPGGARPLGFRARAVARRYGLVDGLAGYDNLIGAQVSVQGKWVRSMNDSEEIACK